MKIVRLGLVPVMLFVVSGIAPGQSRFAVELHGGESFTAVNPGTLSNWGNGWTIGRGLAYRITPVRD